MTGTAVKEAHFAWTLVYRETAMKVSERSCFNLRVLFSSGIILRSHYDALWYFNWNTRVSWWQLRDDFLANSKFEHSLPKLVDGTTIDSVSDLNVCICANTKCRICDIGTADTVGQYPLDNGLQRWLITWAQHRQVNFSSCIHSHVWFTITCMILIINLFY